MCTQECDALAQHQYEYKHAVEVQALSTSTGNNDKPIMEAILDRSGNKQTNIYKHEESQEDEVHIVVLHIWS
jgi:hypothetical protein